jgi:RNAse (barnase) inhibitor barstar
MIHPAANWYSANNIRYVLIDGNTCTQLTDCYTVLQQQLDIPDYFGKNLDALEEVLADLEWIPEEKIKIIILNPAVLLAEEVGKKNDFLSILNTCENERLQVIYAVADTLFKG